MTQLKLRTLARALCATAALSGCQATTTAKSTAPSPAMLASTPLPPSNLVKPHVTTSPANISRARADSSRLPYTQTDIDFMQGMIAHHSQAIYMASWAPSHGASEAVQTLCGRIVNAQNDEINLMSMWLIDRNQEVPTPNPFGMKHKMGGEDMLMLMPGMLSETELKELNAARGKEFDRLFLTGMIRHHRGAVEMVRQLFATPGAGQDEMIFKFASDVNVDQTTEIARMERMLFALRLKGGSQ